MISPAELNYRKKIEEKLIEDEFLFRITVVKIRQVSELGIELCNIEDDDEESVKGTFAIIFQNSLKFQPRSKGTSSKSWFNRQVHYF